ncbi:MAG: MBOAT family protein [Clostridia bacterium]|nr:MBOAT family protein [Clostridia bacterium]
MTLYSPVFILAFLPTSAVIYRTVPKNFRPQALAAMSLAFYILAAGEHFYLLPILAILVYLLSFAGKKGFFVCLFMFVPLRLFGISALGVSFFILRAAAYIYDGKRERNFFKVFAHLLFFPCVHAGPLASYKDFESGLSRYADFAQMSRGICMALYGAFKKLFFADALYVTFDKFFVGGTSLSAFLALIAYALYIYFDFSGCSDMAVGIASVLGFDLPKNFDFPYMSRSVSEFFRRWHITLGRWLFKYIYIPLGGSKKGSVRAVLSLGAVWLASALWHGTRLSYLVWGMYFFVIAIAEKLILPKGFKIGRLCTFCLVLFGWVFFFSDTPAAAFAFFTRLFCLGETLLYCRADIYNAIRNVPFILLAALFATPLPRRLLNMLYSRARVALYILALPLFCLILSCLVSSGHIPFLYASF